jgi:hypothetical protein
MGLLDLPIPRRTRRNHAIEHATIHILTARVPGASFAGRSDSGGFFLYGAVDSDQVHSAVTSALVRLQTEPELAIHPYCGTNMVVGGIVAGLASLAAVATLPENRREAGLGQLLPRLMLAGTFAAVATTSLGPLMQQRVTTLPDSRGVRISGIERSGSGRHVMHRVQLTDDAVEAPIAAAGA